MKLEIGESLIRSWLRHAKKCQFAELNWKPSPLWNMPQDRTAVNQAIFSQAKEHFGNDLFKKSELKQLLHQGEIDALGACFSPESTHFYACDIAFHSTGLLYGSREKTILSVTKKLIRSALLLHSFFEAQEATLVFASPKVGAETAAGIAGNMPYLTELFATFQLNYAFEFYCNADFTHTIFNAVLSAASQVEDTSELFLRSYRMMKLCGGPGAV